SAHSDYLKHTQEEAAILREIVKQGKSQNLLNAYLDSALGNACPLTRFTITAEVPLRKPIALESDTVKHVVVQLVLWYLDSGCSKHIIRDRSQLTNFVKKYLGTIGFENDHVEKIMGYGDYQIGNVTFLRVYYVERFGHKLFSVGQFCDSDIEVAFRQHTCFIRNLDVVDLLTGSQGNNMYTLSLRDMMASSPIFLLLKASKTKSWLWHRSLSHLNFEAVAAACYTQNRSIIRLRHDKIPYELLHDKLLDLSLFYVFGALCYPTNDNENLGKLQPKADIGIFICYAPKKKHSGFTTDVPGKSLKQFIVDHPDPKVNASITEGVASEPAASTGSPSSTIVNQDAPSLSISQTTPETQSSIIANDVKEDNHDLDVAHMNNDPFFGILIPEAPSDQSSSTDIIHTIVHPD
nr:integrase, catalytic region, zinc finger, CCHC-type, peptidase aspartic, catalytic [Tanacetum cinerariifolium]